MKSRFVLAIGALLLAAPALAQTPSTFDGTFRGITPGYDQQMAVTREDEGYRVRIQVKQNACTGQVEAVGRQRERVVTATNGACKLTLYRAGPNVQVEADNCEAFHGPDCSFTNIYAPR